MPVKISKDPSEVIPEADVILMPLPSFAYPAVLEGMRSHLRPGQKLAVTPGQGGFDWTARDVLGEELMRQLTIYAIMPMPFNCRIKKFGKLVEVQEFKPRYRVGCVPDSELDHVMALNEAMFGSTESCGSFLACTLYPINAIIHPARLRTLLMDWSPGQTLPENPLFYEQMTVEGTSLMDKVNKELIAVGASLKEAGIPVEVPHIFDFLAKYVYADPSDTLLGFFAGNAAYKGFRCPLKQTESGGWEPDFQNRCKIIVMMHCVLSLTLSNPSSDFTEDIPLGLCIYKGVADLVGVETPAMDEIIIWAGKHMGKSYIEGGHLSGSDIKETSAPQRFGINTLADLKHRYPSNSVSS